MLGLIAPLVLIVSCQARFKAFSENGQLNELAGNGYLDRRRPERPAAGGRSRRRTDAGDRDQLLPARVGGIPEGLSETAVGSRRRAWGVS
jgi:hypothetical protein